MPKFEVVEGVHFEGRRKYMKGDVVSSPFNLCQDFRGKFKQVEDGVKTSPGKPVQLITKIPGEAEQPPLAVIAPPPSAPTVKAPTGPSGKNKTTQFPSAEEQDFKVYKDEGLYFVWDADDLTKCLNPDGVGVSTKEEVEEVIATAAKTKA